MQVVLSQNIFYNDSTLTPKGEPRNLAGSDAGFSKWENSRRRCAAECLSARERSEVRGGKRMKTTYGLWQNLMYVLRQMKKYAGRSFRMIWLSIPMKVALPLIGILLPNLVVRAVTEQADSARLFLAVVGLGLAAVVCSFAEQYAAGVMEEEKSRFCQSLDDLLFEKRLHCDYENLENKELSGKFDEAENYIWDYRRSLSQAAVCLTLLGSGIFGFLVYLSVLRMLPVWLLLLMTACTVVSFLFSDLGDRERRKRKDHFGEGVRRFAYLQDASADPKAGKDFLGQ